MTLLDLITTVKTNLGNRASGEIGDQSVDTVVLSGINVAMPQCLKLANPTYYEDSTQLTLTVGGPTEYAIPTVTRDSAEHRIKDILYHRASRPDGTPLNLVKKTYLEFMHLTPDYDQAIQSVPSIIAFREGKLYVNRVPSEEITLTLFVDLWPKKLTVSDYNFELPIEVEWQLAVEAYATYYCFMKLQQTTSAQYWLNLYEDQKSLCKQTKRHLDNRGQGLGSSVGMAGNDFLNPFIKRN